jgi:trigger factor
LKINKEYLEDHQVKLIVEIDPEPLERAKHRAARSLSHKTKIPGFRPGKAPYHVIERTVGESTILENALDILIEDIYPKVIEESGISPYGPGTLENMPSLDPPTFEFIVPLDADVKLGNYTELRIPYELVSITEHDVNNVLDDLRNRQAILEPKEGPAEEGNQVLIKLEGKKLNIEEGQDDELVKERPMPVIIESKDSDTSFEWPFSGFSRELIGHNIGDNFSLTYTFPEDSEFESLRGIEAEFTIKIEDIKSRTIPDLDDEFAQSIGEHENLEGLKEAIKESLASQSKSDYDSEYNQQIINKIIEESDIKYPPQMLENEIRIYLDQLENRLRQQGLDLDVYMKSRQITEDELKDEIRPQAEERLKRSLILFEISKAENIQVNEEDVEAQTQLSLEELSRSLTPEQAKKTITPDFLRGWIGNITADLIVQRTLEHLQNVAQGNIPEASEKSEGSEADLVSEQENNTGNEDNSTAQDNKIPDPNTEDISE